MYGVVIYNSEIFVNGEHSNLTKRNVLYSSRTKKTKNLSTSMIIINRFNDTKSSQILAETPNSELYILAITSFINRLS